MIALAAGCGESNDPSAAASEASQRLGLGSDGTLTVGSAIPFPPFEDGSGGKYSGFDVDLVDALAAKLGLTAQFRSADFQALLGDLADGRFDMAASAIRVTPQRRRQAAFSRPYYEAEQTLMVPAASQISGTGELSGASVGVQSGSTGEAYVEDRLDGAVARSFPEASDVIRALKAGQVDAALVDQPVAINAIEMRAALGLRIAQEIPAGGLYALALPKGNPRLRAAVDRALRELAGDGTLAALYRKYFGVAPPRSVLAGTTGGAGR